MRIHTKLIIQTIILILLAVVLFSFYVQVEFRQSAILFQGQKKEVENSFSRIVELKSRSLEVLVLDYSYWDELVNYVKKPNNTWARQYLDTAISTYGVDLMLVYNRAFSAVYHTGTAGDEILYEQFSQKVSLPEVFSQKNINHFFVYVEAGVLEVYGASIHPTDDPKREGQPQGFLLAAKIWDKKYLDEIASITDCQLDLVYPSGKTTFVKEFKYRDEAIQFSTVLRGWNSDPVARIDVTQISRDLIESKAMSRLELVLIVSFLFIIALLYIWFVLHHVYNPLVLISKALGENNLKYIYKMQSGRNEFGEIARLVFKFSENEVQLAKEVELLKAAEDKLEKERDRVQEYLDIAGVMLVILDKDGNISLINKKGCAILGYEEAEITGKNWFRACLPETGREEMFNIFRKIIEGDKDFKEYHEGEVLRKNGAFRVLAFHNAALRNKEAQIIGILFSGEDITERKQVEMDFRKISEELRLIVDSSQSMITYRDRENRFILVNKAFAQMVGLSKNEIEGKSAFELFPEQAKMHWQSDLEVMESRRSQVIVSEPFVLDREVLWIRTEKTPYIDGEGNVIGLISFSLDVTEYKLAEERLRESEERYRVLFNGSHDALMILEPPVFHFISGNDAAIKLFGVGDVKEFVTFSPWGLSPEVQPDGKSSAAKANEMMENAMRDGSCYFEWMHKRTNGEEFLCSVLLSVLTLGGKKIVLASVRDITETKRIENELKRKTEFLEAQIDSSVDGLLVVDEEGKRILTNRKLLDLWNVPQHIVDDDSDEALLQYSANRTVNPQEVLE
ncbi:MAG: PAS domain S-box protein, partial [Candidatus Omnitrophica bacterium]|nr:PAS domain S-box protein [Candidatus Omnitrophota bacterium]